MTFARVDGALTRMRPARVRRTLGLLRGSLEPDEHVTLLVSCGRFQEPKSTVLVVTSTDRLALVKASGELSFVAASGTSRINEAGRVEIQDDSGSSVTCPLLRADAEKVIESWGVPPPDGEPHLGEQPLGGESGNAPERRTAEVTRLERLAYARWPQKVVIGVALVVLGATMLWIGGEVLGTTVVLIEGVGLLHTPILEGATSRWLIGTGLVLTGALLGLGGGSMAVTSWRKRHDEVVTAPIRDPVTLAGEHRDGAPLAFGLIPWLVTWVVLALATNWSAFLVLSAAAGAGVVTTATLTAVTRVSRPVMNVVTMLHVGAVAAAIGAVFDWLR